MAVTFVGIDLSVAMHQMHSCYLKSGLKKGTHGDHYGAFLRAQLSWLMSGEWLGPLGPAYPLLFLDMKPYWRTGYLERPEVLSRVKRTTKSQIAKTERLRHLLTLDLTRLSAEDATDADWEIQKLTQELTVHYKGGRKFPEKTYTRLKNDVYEICREQGWHLWQTKGYEADDWAAMATRLLRPDEKLILATVDSDWLGLCSANVTWFCMHGYYPRVRQSLADLNLWGAKKGYRALKEPRDLWTLKTETGDKSDNLPPGTPREVIDLLAPPSEFDLALTDPWQVKALRAHMDERPALAIGNPANARDFLRRIGSRAFIEPWMEVESV